MLTAEVAENRKMVAKMKAHVAELNKESREKDANLQECGSTLFRFSTAAAAAVVRFLPACAP